MPLCHSWCRVSDLVSFQYYFYFRTTHISENKDSSVESGSCAYLPLPHSDHNLSNELLWMKYSSPHNIEAESCAGVLCFWDNGTDTGRLSYVNAGSKDSWRWQQAGVFVGTQKFVLYRYIPGFLTYLANTDVFSIFQYLLLSPHISFS